MSDRERSQRRTSSPVPVDVHDYADWMFNEFEVEVERLGEQHDRVSLAMKTQFEGSDFWQAFLRRLPEVGSAYYVRTGGFPLGSMATPVVVRKSWPSFWLKTFRRNALDNDRWPRPPLGGWLLPETWYTRVGDTVRTRVVVRYLDGIGDVVALLSELSDSNRRKARVTYQAREEGYYAAHVDVRRSFEVPKSSFDTSRIPSSVEIQVTTQVKDVIGELLHRYYERRRRLVADEDYVWQWDYLSDVFRAGYLGHMAHYLEGVIMELRGRATP